MTDEVVPKTRADRVSLRWLVGTVLALHVLSYVAERFLDDSPGMGFALLFILGPAVIVFGVVWIVLIILGFVRHGPRLGFSRLLGPMLGLGCVIALAHVGLPPWRVRFEILRPYYLAEIWLLPASGGRRSFDVDVVDKELWSGHESLTITYGLDEEARTRLLAQPSEICDGDTIAVHTDLHFGFHAVSRLTSYGQSCEGVVGNQTARDDHFRR